jgi:prepilin-type N-terminal cleavage/methylation domain-containing protein
MFDPGATKANGGFSLIELLVVVAALSILAAMLLPSALAARQMARISTAHAELRTLTIAMGLYRHNNDRQTPPTRLSCATRAAFQLPVELVGYVPGREVAGQKFVDMPDPFGQGGTYLYRAPGPGLLNEYTLVPDAGTIWVPDTLDSAAPCPGRIYTDPVRSPVRWALWSKGPEPTDEKLSQPGQLPVPRWTWLTGPSDTGVITHFEGRHGQIHKSP